jgi:ribosome-binding factor A
MKNFTRSERLGSQIKREIAEIMMGISGIPEGIIISITDVDLTKDLRTAKVYYSVLGNETAPDSADDFFKAHAKQLRMELASRIRVKFAPEVKFILDKTIEHGRRIEELLDIIKNEEQERRDK